MNITSMVGRFGGIVTYNDQTTGVFHTQFEKDQVWSISTDVSQDNMRQLSWYRTLGQYPYWGYILASINALPFMNFTWDTYYPTTQKTPTDMAARLDLLFTTDDGRTYPVAIVMSNLADLVRVETPDLASGATDLATYKTAIRNMFLKIMDIVTVS